jgi:hypothetical protein
MGGQGWLVDEGLVQQVGVMKPVYGAPWVVPRTHGLVESASICPRRMRMLCFCRSKPRATHGELVVFALEGPKRHQVLQQLPIGGGGAGAEDGNGGTGAGVWGILYLENQGSWAVVENPGTLHLIGCKDLKPLLPKPFLLHTRQVTSLAYDALRSELVAATSAAHPQPHRRPSCSLTPARAAGSTRASGRSRSPLSVRCAARTPPRSRSCPSPR